MEILIKILQFLLALSLLIFVHEFGHFFFARLFKMRVEKFYLFFNPWFSLFKFRIGETEYGIGWIPLGGYCKISGMIDESMDTEHISQPPQPWEFRSKPAWQRLIVMVGGVFMNVVTAFAIYIGMSFVWGDAYIANRDVTHGYAFNQLAHEIGFRDGDRIVTVDGREIEDAAMVFPTILIDQAKEAVVQRGDSLVRIYIGSEYTARMLGSTDFMTPQLPFVVEEVVPGGSAEKAGLLPGDNAIAVNGSPLTFLHEYQKMFAGHTNATVDVTVVRTVDNAPDTLILPVQVAENGTIGVVVVSFPVQYRKYTFWESFPAGYKRTGNELSSYWKQVKLIASPETGAYKSLGGFLTIGNIFPGQWDWYKFWTMTAFLSIVLAVMNILPIPLLDGGHVVFLLYEVVTGRKPSDKFMIGAQYVGLALLFLLLLYANGNDIYRFFIK